MRRPPASFVQLGGPVQNHGHGCRIRLLHRSIDQKSLPVPAHVINEQIHAGDYLVGSGLEKCDWRARIERLSIVTGAAIIFPSEER